MNKNDKVTISKKQYERMSNWAGFGWICMLATIIIVAFTLVLWLDRACDNYQALKDRVSKLEVNVDNTAKFYNKEYDLTTCLYLKDQGRLDKSYDCDKY